MSTYWGYKCMSHDPPLESEYWYNHGDEKLAALLKDREALIRLGDNLSLSLPPEIVWLREHPKCTVVVANAHGDTYVAPTEKGIDAELAKVREGGDG